MNRRIHLSCDPSPSPLRLCMLQCRIQKTLMRIETDLFNVETVREDEVTSKHNIKVCRILVIYKHYVHVCSLDMPTLAPLVSQHPK